MSLPKIKKILDKLSGVENINRGGCGISALSIYKHLEKEGKLTKNTKFMYLYADYDGLLYHTNLKKNKTKNQMSPPAHIILRHRGIYMDSTGTSRDINNFNHTSYIHEATLDNLINTINSRSWNFMFNRKKSVPKIEKIIGIKMSEVNVV